MVNPPTPHLWASLHLSAPPQNPRTPIDSLQDGSGCRLRVLHKQASRAWVLRFKAARETTHQVLLGIARLPSQVQSMLGLSKAHSYCLSGGGRRAEGQECPSPGRSGCCCTSPVQALDGMVAQARLVVTCRALRSCPSR